MDEKFSQNFEELQASLDEKDNTQTQRIQDVHGVVMKRVTPD